jgi:hypothetical protein
MHATTTAQNSSAFDRPFRRLPVRAFNRVGGLFERVGLSRDLDRDELVAAARKKAGLHDFGDEWFLEPLAVLIDSLNREARLNPLGKLIQRGRLVGNLVTRLRVEALCKAHPEIVEQDMGQVVVIAGLQRTGTTMLHRLLAADPEMRALASWEALNPLPLPNETPGNPRSRIAQGKMAERGLGYLAPQFFAIHPVEAEAPEEDVLLLDLSFMSQSPEATLYVPSYAAWLEGQDHTRAYAYLRTMMQVLLWQAPAQNWVLKSPHHMEYLDTVLDVFPEARIVQTHRDPRKTMASFCSMVAHGRGVFSDHVDAHEVADHWVRKVRRLMERSIAVREARGESHFIDVYYRDLVADSVAEVKRIYDFSGIPFDPKTEQSARAMNARNVQHKYGRHSYRLKDFGLSEQRIDDAFDFYRARYDIPRE